MVCMYHSDGSITSCLQNVFIELREFSEDVLLLFLRESCATVGHSHAEHAHRIAAELIIRMIRITQQRLSNRSICILSGMHLVLDPRGGGVVWSRQLARYGQGNLTVRRSELDLSIAATMKTITQLECIVYDSADTALVMRFRMTWSTR